MVCATTALRVFRTLQELKYLRAGVYNNVELDLTDNPSAVVNAVGGAGRCPMTNLATASPPGTKASGTLGTADWRLHFSAEDGAIASPWHQVALRPPAGENGVFNFLCEIPKFTRAKMVPI